LGLHHPPATWLGNAPKDGELIDLKIRTYLDGIQTLPSHLMQIQLNLPEDLMTSEFDLKMLLVSRLFAEGLITSGQGAKMIGISRRTFIELLGQYGVSAFQTSEEELLDDLANA
jgi:predicted HTH domain antitoxin